MQPHFDRLTAREIELVDKAGKPRIRLFVTDQGEAAITIKDPTGNARACLIVDGNGLPQLSMADQRGTVRVVASVQDSPSFTLTDDEGNPRWSLILDRDNGQPVVLACNNEEIKAFELAPTPSQRN